MTASVVAVSMCGYVLLRSVIGKQAVLWMLLSVLWTVPTLLSFGDFHLLNDVSIHAADRHSDRKYASWDQTTDRHQGPQEAADPHACHPVLFGCQVADRLAVGCSWRS